VDTGNVEIEILINEYKSGDTIPIKYRHASTKAGCLAASWNVYSGTFVSDGYVQVRLESTL